MTQTAARAGGAHAAATDGPLQRLRGFFGAKSGSGVRHDLEGLRAIAVLGVVIYHLRNSWLPGGFAGVDVFFVLSGYFITGLLLREIERSGKVDLLKFWGRRARRLLPASVVVIVVTVLAAYAMTNPLEAKRVGRDGLFSSVFGMNWNLAYSQTNYLQDPNPSPLTHYWSLGVEEQFYVVWPVILLGLALLWRLRRALSPRRTLFVFAVAIGLASFFLALSQTQPANSFAYFGTFERAWQLALGGLLAVLAGQLARLPQWLLAVSRWVGVALVVGFYFAASVDILYPGRKALVPAVGAALIIAAGEPVWRKWDPVSRILCSVPGQLGGRYSYSWYLWHYPPLVLFAIYLDRPLRIRELGYCAIGTFVLAVLTYHLLENPLRSSRWLAKRHGGRSLALGAALIVIAAVGSQTIVSTASSNARNTGIATARGQVLMPSPGEAAAEDPKVYADGCIRGTNDDVLAPECRYLKDTGHGDVIEVGDSHAAMWFAATLKVAKQHQWGFRFWARNSCPFADVTKLVGNHEQYLACDKWRADVVRRLVAAHPSLVIVESLSSTIPPMFARDSSGKPTQKLVGGEAGRQMWQDGMAKNLGILHRAGIRVLLVHDTPGYPHAMTGPDCVLSHPKNLAACSLPESEALPSGPGDLGAAKQVGGISTVSFTPIFCPDGRCYMVIGNTLAYRDYNHLTERMTMLLEPYLNTSATSTLHGTVSNKVISHL